MGTHQTDVRRQGVSAPSWREELAAEYERVRAGVRQAIKGDDVEEAV